MRVRQETSNSTVIYRTFSHCGFPALIWLVANENDLGKCCGTAHKCATANFVGCDPQLRLVFSLPLDPLHFQALALDLRLVSAKLFILLLLC